MQPDAALQSCRDTSGPLCTDRNRCPAHRITVDPERVGAILKRIVEQVAR